MQIPRWQPPPEHCALLPGTVDIWRLSPDASTPTGLPGGGDWRETVRLRARELLGRYLGARLGEDDIVRAPGGKPHLRDPSPGLGFNLSHTRGLALVAIGPYPDIGIDVEVGRPLKRLLAIAERVLAPDAVRELSALPEADRAVQFLQHWTAMEARQKALGRGILAPPVDSTRVCSAGFTIGDDAWGHVAVAGETVLPMLRFFDNGWTDEGRAGMAEYRPDPY
jgi:hypothetical protein